MEQKTTITFQAAECGEFHNLGQYVECETLKEAYRAYQRFLKTSPQMGPSLNLPCIMQMIRCIRSWDIHSA